jgi:hypothetical protein
MAEIDNLSITLSANASAAIAEIEKLASVLGKFSTASRNAGGAAKQTGDDLKDIGLVTDKAADQTGKAAEKAETAANKFAGIGAALKGFGGRISSIAKGIGIAGKAFTAIPGYFGGKFITSIKDAAMGVANFFGQIKRVAMYRLIRTAIKFITQSFQEGMKNLYAWSNAVNGQFARSMDTLSTASKYAGNSIAAMASPLINALAPAIDFVVDKLVDMFNLFNQIFARLAGQTSYTAARKVASQWQDASDSASGSASRAADKIKRTILGFDEINKLNDANASSGGGGGGGSGGGSSGADMFETRQIDGAVSTFVDQIRAAFEAGDWQGLGTTLGTKINDIVNSIDFASAGRTVGYYINGWFSTKYWTLDAINFTNIGSSIATFLNNAIEQIDFRTIGKLMVKEMAVIGDAAIGFFKEFNWGQAAAEFSAFVRGVYDELTKWFNNTDWRDLGTAIYNKMKTVLAALSFDSIAQSFFTFLGTALHSLVDLGYGFLGTFWGDIVSYWEENIADEDWQEVGKNLLKAIKDGIGNIESWVSTNVVQPFLSALVGEENWTGIVNSIETVFDDLDQFFADGTELVLGAILALSGVNVALGIALMAKGAAGMAENYNNPQWQNLYKTVTGWISQYDTAITTGLFTLGAILALTGVATGLGIAMMIASGAYTAANTDWSGVYRTFGSWLDQYGNAVAGALLGLGVVLILTGHPGLGIGAVIASGGITAAQSGWSDPYNTFSTWLANYGNVAKASLMGIGAILMLTGHLGLGIGAVIAAAGIDAAQYSWSDTSRTFTGYLQSFISSIQTYALVIGVFLLLTGHTALGLGIIAADALVWLSTSEDPVGDAWAYISGKLEELGTKIQTWWNDLWANLWEEIKSNMPEWMKRLFGIESTSTSGEHTIPLVDPDNPSGGAGRSTGITIPVDYAPADGAIEGLAAETLTFWNLLSPEERTVATQTAIGTAVTTVASGFKTKWDKLEEAKKLLGFGGTVSTGAATVASGFKTGWGKLAESVKTLGFTGSVATGASTVASNFLGVWCKLNTGKTLSFEGKVGTPAKTVANAFANDAWSRLGDNPKTVRFIGMVGTAVDKVAKTFKTDFNDNVSDAQKTLPFLGKVATKASAMAADYKTSWGNLSESKKKLSFFGKLKTASDSPAPSTLFKANSTFDYKGVLKKGWAENKTPQQVLGLDNLTSTITVGMEVDDRRDEVRFSGGISTGSVRAQVMANGGIFSNGIWSAISQFANGGVVGKHGSLFLAGEAGPEIVGHVGGRTEVLNQSQLAAAMYSAVHSAMNGVSLDATFYNDNSEQDYEAMYNAVYDAMAAALAKGEALDRDRNNILREINSKEFSQEFSTSGLTQSLERKNRRAGTTVVPVMG